MLSTPNKAISNNKINVSIQFIIKLIEYQNVQNIKKDIYIYIFREE